MDPYCPCGRLAAKLTIKKFHKTEPEAKTININMPSDKKDKYKYKLTKKRLNALKKSYK